MKLPSRPDDRAPQGVSRNIVVVAGLCLLLVAVSVLPRLFMRQTEVVTITRIDAARICRSRASFGIWPRFRSDIPRSSLSYCGLIMSDHGSFELPETSWFAHDGSAGTALFDRLTPGCRYRVVVTGPGLRLNRGQAMSNSNRTLRRAEPLGDCAETAQK